MSGAGDLVLTALAAFGLTLAGVAWLALVDRVTAAAVAGDGGYGRAMAAPFRSALRLVLKEFRQTERPDRALWLGAPILLNALVLAALVVMPLSPGVVGADLSVGVVFFTAMFALVMVAAFAAGWGPNSKYPTYAGYRFIGLMLAYEMPFAITIIAVALPAESLSVVAIAESQRVAPWNIVIQPLGFAIYVVSALAVAFWGPFGMIGSADLAGGVELELGGAPLAVWRFGHYALLLATAAFAVPLFLAGGAGPWLPPEAWSVIKVLAVSGVLVATKHLLVRRRLDDFMRRAWVALIPLSLANLFLVGLVMLLFPGLFGKAGGG
jgi:NADH-quinone oxidoreductase subunit H